MGGERRFDSSLERVFAAPRPLVWALVADTNRWDRASGLTPAAYVWREVDGVRMRAATARELGFGLEWVEPPYRWVEGRFIHGERTFLKGPVQRGGFEARLSDAEDGGTQVRATAYITGESPVLAVMGPIQRARFRGALRRYFDAITDVVSRHVEEDDALEPAVTRARRALMGGYDRVTSGLRTEPNLVELELRARRMDSDPVSSDLRERLVSLLRDRPDEEVSQIRPFELARVWSEDKRDVLRAFLYATRAGLTNLKWQVNCPVCRVSASVVESLQDVDNAVHCEACNIDYGVDFGKHVEAVFQSNPAVREVYPAVYCASSPAFLPHVYAQLTLAPGGEVDEVADLFRGELHVRSLRDERNADTELSDGGVLTVSARAGSLSTEFQAGQDGHGTIRVSNSGEEDIVLLFERAGWAADAVLGSVIASFPDFLDLFATEAPASGVELSVGDMCILFTDLTGSTAMYERIGDAKAFAIVEHHFQVCDKVIREHRGALVKTMGDAVMASFASSVDAVRAAVALEAANRDDFAEHELSMRVGVHSGPCLAVRANDRLDFFGTTVNTAARLEGKAKPGDLVLTAELSQHPTIAPMLDGRPREPFDAELKGIEQIQHLVRIRLAAE